MDFKITMVAGHPALTWDKSTDITTDIWVLTTLPLGSFFQAPTLGNKLLTVKKLTDDTANLAQQYIAAALKPLLQSGRATNIDVTAERDQNDHNRLNYRVQATQPDGLIVSYTNWYSVV